MADRATIARIESLAGQPMAGILNRSLYYSPHPDASLRNFERWLGVVGSPESVCTHLKQTPLLAEVIIGLFGASVYASDILIQNPELAWLVLDPSELTRPIERDALLVDGRRMAASASGYAHKLDRIRFLKQSTIIRIIVAELVEFWSPPVVWRAIADLADAAIILAAEAAWSDYAVAKGIEQPCPVSIFGMGKLGGRELNFSSDVDLVFVLDDEADDAMEAHAARFCEKVGRALSDRMSRGSVFRVDLRLRPFGRSGVIAPKMRAIEAYAEKYAEPWEHLALIRSRAILSSPEIAERWDTMRTKTAFKPHRGEWAIESIVKMRKRLEERSDYADLKRGEGGIRDAEFSAQIMQMLSGAEHPSLRSAETLPVLRELANLDIIPIQAARELAEGYIFLRQVEHRCQLVNDAQTHSIPSDLPEREFLARRMGFAGLGVFEARLGVVRARIRHWYSEIVGDADEDVDDARASLQDRIADWSGVASWIDALPQSALYWKALKENESSLTRVQRVVEAAPGLLPKLRNETSITDQVVSGEVVEGGSPADPIRLIRSYRDEVLAARLKTAWVKIGVRFALDENSDYGSEFADIYDAALTAMAQHHAPGLTIVALGSLAGRCLAPFSDGDIVFLYDHEKMEVDQAERQAQAFLGSAQRLRNLSAPFSVDMRLRPEGRKGAVVVSLEALRRYRRNRIEAWERFAFSRHRLVFGDEDVYQRGAALLHDSVISREDWDELLKMKSRIENERVAAQDRGRNIKVGPGGMDDILWTAHLWLLQHPEKRRAEFSDLMILLRALEEEGVLSSDEQIELGSAWQDFFHLRVSLALHGHRDVAYPADPDKIDANHPERWRELIAKTVEHQVRVREIFQQQIERMNPA